LPFHVFYWASQISNIFQSNVRVAYYDRAHYVNSGSNEPQLLLCRGIWSEIYVVFLTRKSTAAYVRTSGLWNLQLDYDQTPWVCRVRQHMHRPMDQQQAQLSTRKQARRSASLHRYDKFLAASLTVHTAWALAWGRCRGFAV